MLQMCAVRVVLGVITTLALSVSVWAQTVYYVSTTGNDANNGLSWATAKRTIQAAIDAARAGDEIRVAQGTYSRIARLNKNVALKGGYAGSGSNPNDRDLTHTRYPTIIDGGNTNVAINVPYSFTPTNRLLIEGFIIQNGRGTFDSENELLRAGGFFALYGSPVIRYNWFRNNTGRISNRYADLFGGAIGIYEGAPVIENNIFENNTVEYVNNIFAEAGGAAVHVHASFGTVIRNNLFVNNRAIVQAPYGADTYGGAIYIYRGTTETVIVNNTFVGNRAIANSLPQDGSAIWSYEAPLQVKNNIFAGYDSAAVYHAGDSNTSALVGNNCFFGNTPFDVAGNGVVMVGSNLYQDPQFVDAANGDYRLSPTSPCIDAGDSSVVNWDTDLAGNPRIQGSAVDIGAFEFTGGGGGPEGDVNGDGCVDDADLLTVLFAFGQTGSNPADVNRDGIVDDADLLIVLFNFGQGCGG